MGRIKGEYRLIDTESGSETSTKNDDINQLIKELNGQPFGGFNPLNHIWILMIFLNVYIVYEIVKNYRVFKIFNVVVI